VRGRGDANAIKDWLIQRSSGGKQSPYASARLAEVPLSAALRIGCAAHMVMVMVSCGCFTQSLAHAGACWDYAQQASTRADRAVAVPRAPVLSAK
jgi:hypothetical protein